DGFNVIEVADGRELLDFVAGAFFSSLSPRPPDVIVSDVVMPGTNGLDGLELVRAKDAATPVVLVTAFPSTETEARASDLGVAALFSKPCDLTELRRTVMAAAHRAARPEARAAEENR